MLLEVISGGLLFDALEDDIPAPAGFASEWTEEERSAYEKYMWDNAEDGSIEACVKTAAISSEEIAIVIKTLETIKAECEKQATETGYNCTWKDLEGWYLLTMLKLKQQPEVDINS